MLVINLKRQVGSGLMNASNVKYVGAILKLWMFVGIEREKRPMDRTGSGSNEAFRVGIRSFFLLFDIPGEVNP